MLMEPLEQNLWLCTLCARYFMRLDGKMVEVRRPPTAQENYEYKQLRYPGSRIWRQRKR